MNLWSPKILIFPTENVYIPEDYSGIVYFKFIVLQSRKFQNKLIRIQTVFLSLLKQILTLVNRWY